MGRDLRAQIDRHEPEIGIGDGEGYLRCDGDQVSGQVIGPSEQGGWVNVDVIGQTDEMTPRHLTHPILPTDPHGQPDLARVHGKQPGCHVVQRSEADVRAVEEQGVVLGVTVWRSEQPVEEQSIDKRVDAFDAPAVRSVGPGP